MESKKYNSTEYIKEILEGNETNLISQPSQIWIGIKIGLNVLIYGRKWLFFLLIAMIPLFMAILIQEPLFGGEDSKSAFLEMYVHFILLMIFAFGALMISLPLSADEISDHMTDLYLIRPIKRENYWVARWVAANIGLFVLNFIIMSIYYFYFELVDRRNPFFEIDTDARFILTTQNTNLPLYFRAAIILIFATLAYGGTFLLIGSIGNQGFTLGVILAIVEPFFISMLFLDDSKYVPRNNIIKIADRIFGPDFIGRERYSSFPRSLEFVSAIMYIFTLAGIFFALGAWYYRRREFK